MDNVRNQPVTEDAHADAGAHAQKDTAPARDRIKEHRQRQLMPHPSSLKELIDAVTLDSLLGREGSD
jgi:hypothetical protein